MAYPQDNRENLVVTIGTPQTITADLNSADNLEVDLSKKKGIKVKTMAEGSVGNYNRLTNKPQINGVVLEGNKTSEELNIVEDKNFYYKQTTASDVWVIVHNLNKYPSVTVIDSAGEEVIGNVTYDDQNQVTITFSGAFKGSATLN